MPTYVHTLRFQICVQNSKTVDTLSQVRPRALLEYTVEIDPPTEAPLKSHLYHDIPDFAGFNGVGESRGGGETKSLISSINKKGSGTQYTYILIIRKPTTKTKGWNKLILL